MHCCMSKPKKAVYREGQQSNQGEEQSKSRSSAPLQQCKRPSIYNNDCFRVSVVIADG